MIYDVIETVPFYTPLANIFYCLDFEFTPRVHFESAYENEKSLARMKEAQEHIELSDVVSILFNLANMPDSVARELNFNLEDFKTPILHHMDEYKKKFEKVHKVHWEYSNENLVECYKQFIHP